MKSINKTWINLPEEWTDKDVRECLEVIKDKEGINVYKQLEEQYLHWDFQLSKINDNDQVVDLDDKPFDETLVQDGLAEIVQKIYEIANKYELLI